MLSVVETGYEGKRKTPLCFIKHHATEKDGGVEA
jgi:hypothetical protein